MSHFEAKMKMSSTQVEQRRQLLGDVPGWPLGEKPFDELQRALGVAYKIVKERGRGLQDDELLLARAVVRYSSLIIEVAEKFDPEKVDAERATAAAKIVELESRLSASSEKIREMMRSNARVVSEQEQAIELMLNMLSCTSDRIKDRPEWMKLLGKLSGAE